jgi:DNA-binding MarR family transcriptional regulator
VKRGQVRTDHLGDLLQELVNRVSHGPQGQTLAIMNEGAVTLPQVLMLRRLIEQRAGTPSALARSLNMSASAVSQMLDRLFQLELVRRTEDPDDRRRRRITVTPKAKWLVRRLARARSTEYRDGVSKLSPGVQKELATVLARAVKELRSLADGGAEGGTRDPSGGTSFLEERVESSSLP